MKTIRLLLLTLLAMAGSLFTSQAQLQTQGSVLVNVDVTGFPVGGYIAFTNAGTLGGVFEALGTSTNEPPLVARINGGTTALVLDGRQSIQHLTSLAVTNGVVTNAANQLSAPAQITGTNPPCSIEVWAYNPTIAPQENMVAWGRTGGTNSLLAFSYGFGINTGGSAVDRNATGSAIGGHGLAGPSDYSLAGPNLSWGTVVPPAGAWHHLVYTFSGSGKVNKLYVDGVRVVTWTNAQDVVTWAGTNISIGAAHGGGAIAAAANGANAGLALARIRVMDGVLSDANVLNNYNFERGDFTNNINTALIGGPSHRWSFNLAATNDAVNVVVPDTVGGANGQVRGSPGAGTSGAIFDGNKLVMAGGASATGFSPAYVDLPNGLLSSLSASNAGPAKVTFEGWVSYRGSWTWSSFFSFGTTTAGEQANPNTNAAGYNGANYINWGIQGNSASVTRFELTGGGANLHDVNVALQDPYPVALQHWAVTWDEPTGIITLYVNGNVLSQARTSGGFSNIADVNNWLGRDNWAGDNYMAGDYYEFRMYNRILGAGEIATDYAYGPTGVWTNLSDVGTLSTVQIQPLSNTNSWVGMSATLRVTATYTGTGGWQRDVAGDPTIAYVSDTPSVATVSSNGLLRLVGTGSANISAIYGGITNTMALSVSNAPAPTLIHRYPFNQPDLDTTAIDTVGTANGTFTATFVALNKAQLGSGGYVTFPSNIISGPGAITLEAWVDSYTNVANVCIWSFGDQHPVTGAGRNGIMLAERNNLRTFLFGGADPGNSHEQNAQRVFNATSLITGPGNPANPNPQIDNLNNIHVVGVYNPNLGYVQLYLNGQLQAQANGQRPLSTVTNILNYLGRSLYSADSLWNGAIDEFRIWSGALTPEQIAINTATGPNSIVTSPGSLLNVSLNIPNTNTIKTVVQQATFTGNFASVSGVNLFSYGGTNTVITSDNPAVLTASPAGVLTAVAQGTAHVIASYGGFSVTNTVTVADPAPTLIHRYTFNTNADDVVGTAHGTFQSTAHTNGLGQAVLTATNGDFITLPSGVISNQFAVTIEAFASFGTNTSGSWLYGFGDQNGSSQGRNYLYYSPHIGANARAGISAGDPGNGAEQNATHNGGQLDNRTNVAITVVTHPFLGFEQLYLNGALVANNTNVTTLLSSVSPNIAFIGKSLYDAATGPYPPQSYLNATIDDFRIYSGVLTSNQIAIDAAVGANSIITNPGAFVSVGIILPTNTIPVNGSETIAVVGNFANVSNVNLFTYGALGAVTVTSSDTNVVQVGASGLLTGVAAGTAKIVASVTNVSVTNQLIVQGSRNLALKHRWSFNGNANDSVGSANGTLMGTASISAGSLVLTGGANGTGYLDLPNGLISGQTNVTFEVWARRNAVATWARLFDFGNATTNENEVGGGTSYAFLVADNGQNVPRFAFSTNGPGAENPILTAGAAVANGQTNLYTVVFDFTSNFSAFYINGVQQATGNTPLPMSGVLDINDWVGRSQYSADPDFNGTIDEIRIWEGRMLPSEILQATTNGPAVLPFPTLTAVNSPTTTTLSWPYTFARYTLQSSPSLSTPVWSTITNSPVTTNGMRSVTLPIGPAAAYFRLSSYNSGQ